MGRTKQRQKHKRTMLEVYAKGEHTREKWEIEKIANGGEKQRWRGHEESERESRVGVVASPLDCY